MSDGDTAASIGWPVVDAATTPANTIADEINVSRDLAAGVKIELSTATETATPNSLMKRATGGRVNVGTPVNPENATTKTYVDAAVDVVTAAMHDLFVRISGDTMTGNLVVEGAIRVPNSSPASSGYTIAYINGDGRISRGASSERYKKFISDIAPASLGDLFPQLKRYQMRTSDGTWRYGYTAEQIAADPATAPFTVYAGHVDENGDRIPESIDFIGLLLAQVAQLHQRVAELEAGR